MDKERRMQSTQLALRAGMGDRTSLDELISRYYQRTYRFVCSHGINEHDAEDVTQEIYISLLRSVKDFRGEAAFPTWFRRLEKSRIIEYFRKVSNLPVEPVKAGFKRQCRCEIDAEAIVQNLSEKYRDVLTKHYWQRKTFAQIGQEYGIKPEGARSLCRRAIKEAAEMYTAMTATEKGQDTDSKKQINVMLKPEEYQYLKKTFKISQAAVFRALLRLMQKSGRSITRDDLVLGFIEAKLGL